MLFLTGALWETQAWSAIPSTDLCSPSMGISQRWNSRAPFGCEENCKLTFSSQGCHHALVGWHHGFHCMLIMWFARPGCPPTRCGRKWHDYSTATAFEVELSSPQKIPWSIQGLRKDIAAMLSSPAGCCSSQGTWASGSPWRSLTSTWAMSQSKCLSIPFLSLPNLAHTPGFWKRHRSWQLGPTHGISSLWAPDKHHLQVCASCSGHWGCWITQDPGYFGHFELCDWEGSAWLVCWNNLSFNVSKYLAV